MGFSINPWSDKAYEVKLDAVNRQQDRLAVIVTETDGQESVLLFALATSKDKQDQLQLDRQNSTREFVEGLTEDLAENLGDEMVAEPDILCEVFGWTEEENKFLLFVPPELAVAINDSDEICISLELHPGTKVRVESHTV